jgi:hypothetical protein
MFARAARVAVRCEGQEDAAAMSVSPSPPLTPLAELEARLAAVGYAALEASALAELAGVAVEAFAPLAAFWHDLPPDTHLRDGGRYRRRRHGCFVVEGAQLAPVPHRPHWQPVTYNALHGGIERWFEPIDPAMTAHPAFGALLVGLADLATSLHNGVTRWFVEAHPFRIDCTDGIGRPTPEGAHRDGVDLVAVVLVGRRHVKGGETRVFDAEGPQGVRFTLAEPWSALVLDDARVIHETTPIQAAGNEASAYRDTLVLTYRQGGFQGPE